jgi:hypothetical protein
LELGREEVELLTAIPGIICVDAEEADSSCSPPFEAFCFDEELLEEVLRWPDEELPAV